MEDSHQDIRDTEVNLKIPLSFESIREELNFYKDLKLFFKEHGKPTVEIDFIINNLESNIEIFNNTSNILLREQDILKQIAKHPYFKNPGDYPIRLLTILKYLKKKGFNMQYKDIDIYIDQVIQKLEGVKKVGRGLYKKV